MRVVFAQSVLIIILELNIYLFLGSAMKRHWIFPRRISFLEGILFGFCAYHFLFWCMAFPFSTKRKTLDFLASCWCAVVCILMVAIAYFCRSQVAECYREVLGYVRNYWRYLLLFALVVLVVSYYVSLNGQVDLDAKQYLGEVTTRVDTNSLSGYAPYTGEPSGSVGVKHGMAMFGTNSAVLCVLYAMHPLTYCRIVRGSMNILLLSAVLLALFYRLFSHFHGREAKLGNVGTKVIGVADCAGDLEGHDVVADAFMETMFSLVFLFLFGNTIYTSSAFILHRAYEGKAYCSSLMVLLTLYLSARVRMTGQKRYFALLFLAMAASLATSGSAALVTPLMAAAVVGAWIFLRHKWGYLPMLALSLMPNFCYFYLISTKFAGFVLEE